ncbi:MAG: hypothetical protein ACPGSL_05335 [Vicingaceae bacterium]
MKIKTKLFILAGLLSGTVSYGQDYASRQNAVNGILSPAPQVTAQGTSNKVSIFEDDFSGGLGTWTTNDADGDASD